MTFSEQEKRELATVVRALHEATVALAKFVIGGKDGGKNNALGTAWLIDLTNVQILVEEALEKS